MQYQRKKPERLYVVWKGMRARCNNPNHSSYPRYGGRGIKVCDAWNDYFVFREWALKTGYDEKAEYQQCTLDRIDINGNYEPSNCRWANATEQNLNQIDTELISFDGKEMTLCQWADFLGVNRTVFIQRKRRGWDMIKIISTPVGTYEWGSHCKKRVLCVETGEVFDSIKSAAENCGVSSSNISMVLKHPNKTSGG